ncbi:hypothetical protein PM082_012402 [Marasmius tenuissimus]|nr:hypothetical protein PM082_012402 [Marasmius tenuissimus]
MINTSHPSHDREARTIPLRDSDDRFGGIDDLSMTFGDVEDGLLLAVPLRVNSSKRGMCRRRGRSSDTGNGIFQTVRLVRFVKCAIIWKIGTTSMWVYSKSSPGAERTTVSPVLENPRVTEVGVDNILALPTVRTCQ